jgi:hypothetical protein
MARIGRLAVVALVGLAGPCVPALGQEAAPTPGQSVRPRTDGFRARTGGMRPRISGVRPNVEGVRPDVKGVRPNIKGVNPGRPRSTTRNSGMVDPQSTPSVSTGGTTSSPGIVSSGMSSRDRLGALLQNDRKMCGIGTGVVSFDPGTGVIAYGPDMAVTGAWGAWGGMTGGAWRPGITVDRYVDYVRRWDDNDWYDGPIYGTEIVVNPELLSPGVLPASMQPEPALPPRGVVELARDAAQAGDFEEAIELYRTRLAESPSDAGAMRELAIVLLIDKRDDDGVAMMLMAYRTMPEMGGYPARLDEFGLETARSRMVLQRQVARAHRTGASADYLSAAALMQALDRNVPALRMLEKAESAGLDAEIVDAMRTALDVPAA